MHFTRDKLELTAPKGIKLELATERVRTVSEMKKVHRNRSPFRSCLRSTQICATELFIDGSHSFIHNAGDGIVRNTHV